MTANARWRALEWLVTALVAAPLLSPGWLPFTDLPEHAAAMGSIAHFGDPSYAIDEHYFIGWTTSQYLLVHLLGGVLTMLTGSVELVIRLLLVGLVVAWMRSTRALLRAFGGDERLAILGGLLFWNRALGLGFLPYLVSLPTLFATLALFRGGDPALRGRRAALAVAAVAVFYAHASAFTILVAIAGVVTLLDALAVDRQPTRVVRLVVARLVWLLPAGGLAAVWILRGKFGMRGSTIHDGDEIGTMGPLRAMKVMALWAHDIWPSHVDDAVGIVFWVLFLFLLARGRPREQGDGVRLAPFAVGLAVYLVTPFRVGTGVLLNVRMAPVLALFALLALKPRKGLVGTLPIAVGAALAVVQCIDNVAHVRSGQRDVDGVSELLERIPRGAKLISLNFSGYDPDLAHAPQWIYAGSYHRARNGGVASFSFSELAHWSVQYRPEGQPPRQDGLAWAMNPCLYRNARDGAWFDHVLVRGAVNPFRDDPRGPRWKVLGHTAKFTLWEKDPARPDRVDGDDPGPCAGLERASEPAY